MAFSELASHWATLGYRVLPLRPLDSANGGKVGYRDFPYHATNDTEQIVALARRYGECCGVGICTTGMLVVDVDGADGHAVMQEFEQRGLLFPTTMIFRSPVDPFHYKLLYRSPAGVEFKQTCGWKSDGVNPTKIDLKAWHCLVVAGSSVHKSGLPTLTENEMPFATLPEAPAWLQELLKAQKRMKTAVELRAAGQRHTEWREDDGFSIKPYVDMAIAQFPTAVGHRHDPTTRLIGKLCCSRLSDIQIMEVGKLWLRHYEGQYGLTYEQALARFQTILTSTRSNPKFIPFKFDILSVALPSTVLSFLDEIEEAEGRPSRILVEVVMREWILESERETRETHSPSPHHFTLNGVEVENTLFPISITLTWKQIKDGYRLLSDSGIDDHRFLDLKAKFFSLPDWGENGTRAKTLELFIRTSKGSPGRPSTYEPSEWLARRLSQAENPKQPEAVRMDSNAKEEKENIKKALMASKSGYYKTAYYKKFVAMVKQRDNYTCQACGTQFNQPSMQVVCIKGMVSRIRDAANYACACKKCAALYRAIDRGDDVAMSKYKPQRIEQVINAWHPELLDAVASSVDQRGI